MFNLKHLVSNLNAMRFKDLVEDVEKLAGKSWGVNTATLGCCSDMICDHLALLDNAHYLAEAKGVQLDVVFGDSSELLGWLNYAAVTLTRFNHDPTTSLTNGELAELVLDETRLTPLKALLGNNPHSTLTEIHRKAHQLHNTFKEIDDSNQQYLRIKLNNGIHSTLVVLEEVVGIICQTR